MGLFQVATRNKEKLRLALCGPSGSGKTWSALMIAKGLGGKVAMIDSERGSGALYSNAYQYFRIGIGGKDDLYKDYNPANYCALIEEAEKEGFDVLIIDSLSHAWEGEGGVLDIHGNISKTTKGKNTFNAWWEVTPQHNKLVDTILRSKMHIIVCMRTKVEYEVLQEFVNGKNTTKVNKVGTKPIQREGLDYEFTVVLDLSIEGHIATSSKDRTGLFDGKAFKPSEADGVKLIAWLETGEEAVKPEPKVVNQEEEDKKFLWNLAKVRMDKINIKLTEADQPIFTNSKHYWNALEEYLREDGQSHAEAAKNIIDHEEQFINLFVAYRKQKNQQTAA